MNTIIFDVVKYLYQTYCSYGLTYVGFLESPPTLLLNPLYSSDPIWWLWEGFLLCIGLILQTTTNKVLGLNKFEMKKKICQSCI